MARNRLIARPTLAMIVAALALTMTMGAAPSSVGNFKPGTYHFSGVLTGTTQGLPVDTNGNGHMATMTESVNTEFLVHAYGETDVLPFNDPDFRCTLPNGQLGFRSKLVPGGGQQVWDHPSSGSQLWVQSTVRELCAGGSTSTFYEEAEILGGFGQFQGATGSVIATTRANHTRVFRILNTPNQVQLTVPQLSYALVAVTTQYEMDVTIPEPE